MRQDERQSSATSESVTVSGFEPNGNESAENVSVTWMRTSWEERVIKEDGTSETRQRSLLEKGFQVRVGWRALLGAAFVVLSVLAAPFGGWQKVMDMGLQLTNVLSSFPGG